MSEIRNESLNIWGCDVVHILNNILNITIPIPQKNSLDHSWVELSWADDPSQWAVWRTGRGEGEWGLRWEKWRLGELVYWFPEPPSSSLLPPLLRGATSHTVPRPAPTAWLCSNQQTSFLSSHSHSATQPQPQPTLSNPLSDKTTIYLKLAKGATKTHWLSFMDDFIMPVIYWYRFAPTIDMLAPTINLFASSNSCIL